jgi:hypothetical protein
MVSFYYVTQSNGPISPIANDYREVYAEWSNWILETMKCSIFDTNKLSWTTLRFQRPPVSAALPATTNGFGIWDWTANKRTREMNHMGLLHFGVPQLWNIHCSIPLLSQTTISYHSPTWEEIIIIRTLHNDDPAGLLLWVFDSFRGTFAPTAKMECAVM